MKGLFVLAALGAALLWLSMPSGSEARVGDDLFWQVERAGHVWSQSHPFDNCEVVDNKMECTAVIEQNLPPLNYRVLKCDSEGENCTLLKSVPGEISCYKLSGRERQDCTWGSGLTYTFIARIDIAGEITAEYSHQLQQTYLGTTIIDGEVVPRFGNVGRQRGGAAWLDRECLRALRQQAKSGEYGPVPECEGGRYRYDQDTGTVPVE